MNPLKNGSTASMTDVSSLTIMRVAFSSVNCGSNEKPIAVKNSVALGRSFTGRLTKGFGAIVNSLLTPGPSLVLTGGGGGTHSRPPPAASALRLYAGPVLIGLRPEWLARRSAGGRDPSRPGFRFGAETVPSRVRRAIR